MKHTLKAVQCAKEGKLYLTGTITTPTAGYVVDTLSLSFGQLGDKASLEMDLYLSPGGGMRSILNTETETPVTLAFDTDEFVSTLTIYTQGQRIDLPVGRVRDPEPTD